LSDTLGLKLKEEINSPLIIDIIDDFKSWHWGGKSCYECEDGSMWGHWLFYFFLTNYDERVTHNMLSFLLDPIHKSLKSKFSFIGHDKGMYAIYSD
jgi:hypothetical protein